MGMVVPMPIFDAFGDLAAAWFNALYDLRIPLAIGSAVAVAVAALVAWRRGWVAAARRHPARTGVLIALALAVGAPLTWYLASPIFIRTALVEPAPGPANASSTPAVSPTPGATVVPAASPSTPALVPSDPPEPTPFSPRIHASGAFHGSDEFHFGRGTASIIETAPGRFHVRLEDFSVRNGPDLFVYLSPAADGFAKGALELGRLKATDGSFGYDLPAGTDPADFASAVIWCKQFSHLFATAPFESA
jgi:Electron transfer DM13